MAFSLILLEELPRKVDSITPYTMALIAKYIARHRLRETQLLDTIAEFLVKKGEYLDSKVRRGNIKIASGDWKHLMYSK